MEKYILSHFYEALETGRIRPFFQPVYRSITEKICDAEALARWEDADLGLLSPGTFIPVLEKHGLIYELDMAILRQSCDFYSRLQHLGTPLQALSVNLSRQDFDEPDLFENVVGTVRECGVPPEAIKLEITESVMLEDIETFQKVFGLFHSAGFNIWIDDFGSGYSSLNMLQNYDFDVLKFDLHFLRNFTGKSRQMLSALVNMAKNLGIHTLAEGVETGEQVSFLRSIGCEALQGFYYSRPLPADQFVDKLKGGAETAAEKEYWNQIGFFNFLSTSPLEDFGNEITSDPYTGSPLALIECGRNHAAFAYTSTAFMQRVYELGHPSLLALEHAFNDKISNRYLLMKRLVTDAISNNTIQEVEYKKDDVYFRVRGRCLAKTDEKAMLALQLRTFDTEKKDQTETEMLKYGNALFNTYELATAIYPARDSSERIYSRESIQSYASIGNLRESFIRFSRKEIVPADRERYMKFCELDTLEERLQNGFIQGYFRLESSGEWRSVKISRIPSDKERSYLYTIRKLQDGEKTIIDTFAEEHPEKL